MMRIPFQNTKDLTQATCKILNKYSKISLFARVLKKKM